MASLGSYLLLTAFVVCAYATAASVAGARRRSRALIESGVGAFYLVAAVMAAASAVIVYSFVTGDFSIKYVAHYSDSVQPLFYRLTSYWGGLDGSIMFWVFMLSCFGSAAVYVNRERHRELIPYVVAVISVVEMFFLFLMVIHNNPFETFITSTPTDGKGLNPLLQNFYMVIHPPTMYLGFVGLTIPYAFGMAALITGHLDDSWLRADTVSRLRWHQRMGHRIVLVSASLSPYLRPLGRRLGVDAVLCAEPLRAGDEFADGLDGALDGFAGSLHPTGSSLELRRGRQPAFGQGSRALERLGAKLDLGAGGGCEPDGARALGMTVHVLSIQPEGDQDVWDDVLGTFKKPNAGMLADAVRFMRALLDRRQD